MLPKTPPDEPPEDTETLRLEARVLEAERRVIPAILHFLDLRKTLHPRDPRRRATKVALIWIIFSGGGLASTGLFTVLLTVATVYLACQANTIIKEELSEIRAQNKLTREQFAAAQNQFALQRRAEAQRRHSELLTTLFARKDCASADDNGCPFIADGLSRVYALVELASRQADIATHDETIKQTVNSIVLSDIRFPEGVVIENLRCLDLDMSFSDLRRSLIQGAQLPEGKFRRASFEEVAIRNSNLENADLRNARFDLTSLHDVNLTGAIMNSASVRGLPPTAEKTAMTRSPIVLENVNFTGADLRGVEFADIILQDCKFDEASLDGAKFSEHYSEAIGSAKTCPNGEAPNGTCRGKMTPSDWLAPATSRRLDFWSRVQADIQYEAEYLDLPAIVAVRFIIFGSRDSKPEVYLDRVFRGDLTDEHIRKLSAIIRRHAELIGSRDPMVSLDIQAADTLITAGRPYPPFSTENFRTMGCIGEGAPRSRVWCTANGANCEVSWPSGDVPVTCHWDAEQTEERVEYLVENAAHRLRIASLGRRSLLRMLGFRPGDILEAENSMDWPMLRHSEIWSTANRVWLWEEEKMKVKILRHGKHLSKTIVIKGSKSLK